MTVLMKIALVAVFVLGSSLGGVIVAWAVNDAVSQSYDPMRLSAGFHCVHAPLWMWKVIKDSSVCVRVTVYIVFTALPILNFHAAASMASAYARNVRGAFLWIMIELRGPNHHQLQPHLQGQNNVAPAG